MEIQIVFSMNKLLVIIINPIVYRMSILYYVTCVFLDNRVAPGHVMGVFLGLLAGYHKFFKVNDYPILTFRTDASQKMLPAYDWSIKMYDDPGRPDRV